MITTRVIRSLKRLAGAGTALFLGFAAAGCAQVYTVKVDAIRTPEVAPRRSYHLVAADPERAAADPAIAEAMVLAGRALDASGLFAASRPEWADMIVTLDLGISHRRLVAVPDPKADDGGATSVYLPDRGSGTVGESTGSNVSPQQIKRIIAVWEKRLSVVARENKPDPSATPLGGAELWRVDVSVQDTASDLTPLLPVLAAALKDSVDRDTAPSTRKHLTAAGALTLVSAAD